MISASSAERGFFFGGKDRVIVGGSFSRNQSLVQGLLFIDENCSALSSADVTGKFSCMEMCHSPRFSKNFLLYLTCSKSGTGNLSVIDILNSNSYNDFKVQRVDEKNNLTDCPASFVAYNNYTDSFGVSTESGKVTQYDLENLRPLGSFISDRSGVAQIMSRSVHEMVTLGKSINSQLKIWDLRSQRCIRSYSYPKAVQKHHKLTCFHSTNYETILLGAEDGNILYLDTRSESFVVNENVHCDSGISSYNHAIAILTGCVFVHSLN